MPSDSRIVFHVGRALHIPERELLLRSFGPGVDVEVLDSSDVPPHVPSAPEADRSRVGQQYSFGVDVGTLLMVALASGSAVFLKKITEEAAGDFWRAVKRLVECLAERDKAAPIQSTQLQLCAGIHRGVEIHVVLTALNVRFLADDTWNALMEDWRSELERRLAMVRRDIDADESRLEGRLVLHAVVHGGSRAEWHISRVGRDRNAEVST